MPSKEAELLQNLEDRGLLTVAKLADWIECSLPTARSRIANGGLSLGESKLLLERTRHDRRIGDALDSHIHAHSGRLSIRLDDYREHARFAGEGVEQALQAISDSNQSMSQVVQHALSAAHDGEINADESEQVCEAIDNHIRDLVEAKQKVQCNTTHRAKARPLKLG